MHKFKFINIAVTGNFIIVHEENIEKKIKKKEKILFINFFYFALKI